MIFLICRSIEVTGPNIIPKNWSDRRIQRMKFSLPKTEATGASNWQVLLNDNFDKLQGAECGPI